MLTPPHSLSLFFLSLIAVSAIPNSIYDTRRAHGTIFEAKFLI